MQCTIARRVGIAMAPTIKNPPNQVLSLKPGQLWVGTRHTQRSWIISGHADCQGRCKRGTAWMIFKSVNKQTNNLWFKTFHLDRLWQSCWVWQWCCRPRTPSLTTWSSCRWTWPGTWAWPGRAQSVKTRFCWQHFFCGKSFQVVTAVDVTIEEANRRCTEAVSSFNHIGWKHKSDQLKYWKTHLCR